MRASEGTEVNLTLTGSVAFDQESLEAAGKGDDAPPPSFDLVAYNGGKMRPKGFPRDVVLEMSGISYPKTVPTMLDHEHTGRAIVGHGEPFVGNGKLQAKGVVSAAGATEAAHTVISAAKGGFPWKTSIGATVQCKPKLVPAGSSKIVNGQRHDGPFDYIAKAHVHEISFVPIGADSDTSAAIAATKETLMSDSATLDLDPKFKEFLEAKGVDIDGLTEESVKGYELAFKMEASAGEASDTGDADDDDTDQESQDRLQAAAEITRRAEIQKIAAESPEIAAKAVGEGWTIEATQLALLQEDLKRRPKSTSSIAKESLPQNDVIEARMLMDDGVPAKWLEASGDHWRETPKMGGYDEETLNRASDLPNYTFGRMFREFLASNGVSYSPGATTSELLPQVRETCLKLEASSTGFSTINVTGILSNVMGKRMLNSFYEVPPIAQRVSANRSVPDFKETSAFRMTGNGDFLEITDTDEIQSMQLQEEKYTNRPKTYGRIIRASRKMLINDDLGALTAIPRVLGRKAALKLQSVFFDMWLALETSGFFSAGNGNLITDVLSIDGLTAGETAFLSLEDADEDPIAVEAQTLLVPQDLKVPAEEHMSSTTSMVYDRNTSGDTSRGPVTNPHVGKWSIEWTPWLKKAATKAGDANGATSWYLIAPPSVIAAAEIVYLNGRNTPTIEGEEASFDVLGRQWRGYFDFGVREQDHRGAVKSTGTTP